MEANQISFKVRSNSDITWRDVQIQHRKISQLVRVFHHPRSRFVCSSSVSRCHMKCPRDVNNPLSKVFLTSLIMSRPKSKIKNGQILFSPLLGVPSFWLLIISSIPPDQRLIFAGKQPELSVISTLHLVLWFVFVALIVFFSNLLMIVDVAFFTSTHRNGGNSSGKAVATRAPR